jgi:hypothetical protein
LLKTLVFAVTKVSFFTAARKVNRGKQKAEVGKRPPSSVRTSAGRGFGDLGIWGFGDLGIWGFGDLGIWGFGDLGIWGFGDLGIWGLYIKKLIK